DFAEMAARTQVGQHAILSLKALADFDETQSDHVKVIGRFTLAKDRLSGIEPDQVNALAQKERALVALSFVQASEKGDALQMAFQGPFAVDAIQDAPGNLAALQNVEDIARNLQDFRVLASDHGGGAGIMAHAGHLADDDIFGRANG